MKGTFPFGQPLKEVRQSDRTVKDVFVLGVYASAVHARWTPPKGMKGIAALAVASEPEIFWRGNDAAKFIPQISEELGQLEPAEEKFNGPSGRALDKEYLEPLKLDRSRCWLSDLVPHACLNPSQKKAIDERYRILEAKYNLSKVTIPDHPKSQEEFTLRSSEIIDELKTARPKLVITLGDEPIRWFFSSYLNKESSLIHLLKEKKNYGRTFACKLNGIRFNLLPLVHPRQAAKLGLHSEEWYDTHLMWKKNLNQSDIEKYFDVK